MAPPRLLLPNPAPLPASRRLAAPESPRLSVVIVNYRQWGNTAALVRQLRRSSRVRAGAAEVVVVDNHSGPHPLARRMRRWAGVSLRRWGRNRGFARAVNEGWRLSRGEWLLLLNPDMSVPPGFLDGVLAAADRLASTDPRAGIVGFALRNADGSPQMSAGHFPSLASTLAGLARTRARRKYRDVPPSGLTPVDWVTGCCLLIRGECLRDVGGLDPDYFLYYEDVDLCWRARARGWAVLHEPASAAVHHSPLHARAVPPALRVVTRHSLLTYASKHWPRWQLRLLTGIVRLEALARRVRACWRGDDAAARLYCELGEIASDMASGRPGAARKRLDRVVRTHALADGSTPLPSPARAVPA